MQDKHQTIEEPCALKGASTVLKGRVRKRFLTRPEPQWEESAAGLAKQRFTIALLACDFKSALCKR